MTTRKTKQRAANAALTIFLLTVSIIVLSPLLLALLNSFKTLSEITYDVAALPETWQTANYERAWDSLNFPRALLNSLLVTVLSNAGVVLISSMAAYRIVRHPTRSNRALYKIFLAEMILPFQVVMIPLTIVIKKMGLIDSIAGVVFAYLGMGVAMGVLANALASVLGVRIRQHQQKRRSKFYILPRAKTSRFPEKSSEKRLKTPWVKVQVHRICLTRSWHLFVTLEKMGAKKPGSR